MFKITLFEAGKHSRASGRFCAVEYVRLLQGYAPGSDLPRDLIPDVRPINDAPWPSDEARTAHMAPMMRALYDWPTWPEDRRNRFADRVRRRTVREIIEKLPNLPPEIATRCWEADTADDLAAALCDAASLYAARSVYAAARSVYAAALPVLALACRIWREEAEKSAVEPKGEKGETDAN